MNNIDAIVSAFWAHPKSQKALEAGIRRMLGQALRRPEEPGAVNDDPLDELVSYSNAAGDVGLKVEHIRNLVVLGEVEGYPQRSLINRRSLEDYISQRFPTLEFDLIAQEQEVRLRKRTGPQIKVGPEGSITYEEAAKILGQNYSRVATHIRMGRLNKAERGYVWRKEVEALQEKRRSVLPGARLRVVKIKKRTKPAVLPADPVVAAAAPPPAGGNLAAR